MITWLQTIFLKHNKILFSILLAVVIMTFVLTIGNQSFFGTDTAREVRRMEFFGYNLANEADVARISQGAQLSAALNPDLRLQRSGLEEYAYSRIAALGVANRIHIPAPSEEQMKTFIQEKRDFQDQEGNFDPERYNRFVEMLSNSGRYSRETIARVLREDFRIERVKEALGGPGYLLPFEAKKAYEEDETTWSLAVAERSYADYNPGVDPDEEALRNFYDQSPERYRIPELIALNVIKFPLENYLNQVETPDEPTLRAYFERNRQEFEPEDNNETEAEEAASITFAEARPEVVEAVRRERARRLAAEAADKLTVTLWRQNIEKGSEAYQSLLNDMKVEISRLPAYARTQPPVQTGVPRELLDAAWLLVDSERYFSDLAQTDDGAVVLIFEKVIESRIAPFEEIRSQVENDYLAQEKRRLFTESGEEIHQSLIASLNEGKTFAEAAEEVGLPVNRFENFKGMEPPQSIRFGIFEQARELEEGELSEMVFSGSSGRFVYVLKKEVPQIDLESEEVGEKYDQLRTQLGNFDGWSMIRQIASDALAEYRTDPVPEV